MTMANSDYEIIKKISEHPELADEMEKVSPGIKAKMSGYLLSPWLPRGISRKLIMLIILIVAIIGCFFYGKPLLLILLLLLPLFSPRIAGEIALFMGNRQK